MALIVKFPFARCLEHNTPLFILEDSPFRERTDKCIARKTLLWEYFELSPVSLHTYIRSLRK